MEPTLDRLLADARAYLERIPQEPEAALADLLVYLLAEQVITVPLAATLD